MIEKLTWRNLWRNPRRTSITMASIAFAVFLSIVMKSLQDGVFDNLIKNVVSFYSGHIQIHQQGYWDEQILENSMAMDTVFFQNLEKSPNIQYAAPRIESFA